MSERKLWRLGTIEMKDGARTVVEVNDCIYELKTLIGISGIDAPDDDSTVFDIIQEWDAWYPTLTRVASGLHDVPLDPSTFVWLPPILNPSKIICTGANYYDHLAELGVDRVKLDYPFAFFKPLTTLLGHERELRLPQITHLVDWEAELAIVIGRRAKDLSGKETLEAVAGYTVFNDISARDWLDRPYPLVGMDLLMAKAFDGFAPIGPLITPREFVPNPQELTISLTVNGETKQDSSTGEMIFGVREILEHLSSVMTLEPGDIISTGCPAGIGHPRREYLRGGDVLVVEITDLGQLITRVTT